MTNIRHVIQHLLGMDVEFAKMIQLPMNPAGILPLLQRGRGVIRLAAFLIKPRHDATHGIHHRVGANGCGLGARPVMIGNIVDVALRVIAPSMVRAAYRIALNLLPIPDDHRRVTRRQMGAHVATVRIQ